MPETNPYRMTGKRASRALTRLCRRYKFKCFWCGKHVERAVRGTVVPHTATTDHVIPLSKGGPNDDLNLVLACAYCNLKRTGEKEPFKKFFKEARRLKAERKESNNGRI